MKPGSAEFASVQLHGRALKCKDFPKYGTPTCPIKDIFPSRLGFFYDSEPETRISYLETKQLCVNCLRLVVPDGFNYWSMLAVFSESQLDAGQLEALPSSDMFLPIIQAGTEGSPAPISIAIPDVPGAKEAWDWLQRERKPFYIDQLHLTKKLTPSGRKTARADVILAIKNGIPFPSQTSQPGPIDNSALNGLWKLGPSVQVTSVLPLATSQSTSAIDDSRPEASELSSSSTKRAFSSRNATKSSTGFGESPTADPKKDEDNGEEGNESEVVTAEHEHTDAPADLSETALEQDATVTEKDIKHIKDHPENGLVLSGPNQNLLSLAEVLLESSKSGPPIPSERRRYTKHWSQHEPIVFEEPKKRVVRREPDERRTRDPRKEPGVRKQRDERVERARRREPPREAHATVRQRRTLPERTMPERAVKRSTNEQKRRTEKARPKPSGERRVRQERGGQKLVQQRQLPKPRQQKTEQRVAEPRELPKQKSMLKLVENIKQLSRLSQKIPTTTSRTEPIKKPTHLTVPRMPVRTQDRGVPVGTQDRTMSGGTRVTEKLTNARLPRISRGVFHPEVRSGYGERSFLGVPLHSRQSTRWLGEATRKGLERFNIPKSWFGSPSGHGSAPTYGSTSNYGSTSGHGSTSSTSVHAPGLSHGDHHHHATSSSRSLLSSTNEKSGKDKKQAMEALETSDGEKSGVHLSPSPSFIPAAPSAPSVHSTPSVLSVESKDESPIFGQFRAAEDTMPQTPIPESPNSIAGSHLSQLSLQSVLGSSKHSVSSEPVYWSHSQHSGPFDGNLGNNPSPHSSDEDSYKQNPGASGSYYRDTFSKGSESNVDHVKFSSSDEICDYFGNPGYAHDAQSNVGGGSDAASYSVMASYGNSVASDAGEGYDGGSYGGQSYGGRSDGGQSYGEPSHDEPSYKEPSYEEPSYDEPSYDEPSYGGVDKYSAHDGNGGGDGDGDGYGYGYGDSGGHSDVASYGGAPSDVASYRGAPSVASYRGAPSVASYRGAPSVASYGGPPSVADDYQSPSPVNDQSSDGNEDE